MALRAREGAFDNAYLAKWPGIEGQLMPVLSVASSDVYNGDILSISLGMYRYGSPVRNYAPSN
jgi:hypothetical protein